MIVKINENQFNLIKEHRIDENAWQWVKNALANGKETLYKLANKKLEPNKKEAESLHRILDIIDKRGNELIKSMDEKIGEIDPNFPNGKDDMAFLKAVLLISSTYDSIVAATKKNPNDENYLPVDMANALIEDLSSYVKTITDGKLKSVYSVVDEMQGSTLQLTEEQLQELNDFDEPTGDNHKKVRDYLKGRVEFNKNDIHKKGIKKLGVTGLMVGLSGLMIPLGIIPSLTGIVASAIKLKSVNQSREATLDALYNMMQEIDGGYLEDAIENTEDESPSEETPDSDVETTSTEEPEIVDTDEIPSAEEPSIDTTTSNTEEPTTGPENKPKEPIDREKSIYNSLQALFGFITNNRKTLGVKAGENVGTGNAINRGKMRTGETYKYNGKNVKILNPTLAEPNKTQIQYPNGTKLAVDTNKLERLSESLLSEGQFIKDKRTQQFLEKNLSIDKLRMFEKLISNIQNVRGQVKYLKGNQDKAIQNFMKEYDQNLIMKTDFVSMFNIPSENAKEVNSLKHFIDDVFVTLYSGKYKFGSIVDKMTGMNEGVDIDPQDRRLFKANLIKFLTTSIHLFQYLSKAKK